MTNPAEVIEVTVAGSTFRACRFCAAHIQDAADRNPGLRIIQPPWNVGVTASAGTHDKCACFDVYDVDLDWLGLQRRMRELGWAAWYREATPGLWGNHVHMVSLGCPAPKGIYVQGQINDYYDHRTGLAGHAADPTWHPKNIDATVFDYAAWTEEHEMTPDQDAKLTTIADTVTRLEERSIRQAQRIAGLIRDVRGKVKDTAVLAKLDEIEQELQA